MARSLQRRLEDRGPSERHPRPMGSLTWWAQSGGGAAMLGGPDHVNVSGGARWATVPGNPFLVGRVDALGDLSRGRCRSGSWLAGGRPAPGRRLRRPRLPRPGSRSAGRGCRPGTWSGDDGPRVFDGWFDTARGEYCRVARGQNGRYYCFPAANPVVFSDARCQQPLGQHLECAFRYTGVARGDRRCGNETLTLWEEGEPVALPSRYRLANDFCAGPDTSAGGSFVGLTARVPGEQPWWRASRSLARASLRLGPRVIRFQDGATAPFEMYDNSQNAGLRAGGDRPRHPLPARERDLRRPDRTLLRRRHLQPAGGPRRRARLPAPIGGAGDRGGQRLHRGCARPTAPARALDPRDGATRAPTARPGRIMPGPLLRARRRGSISSTFPELQDCARPAPAASACAPTAPPTTSRSPRWASTCSTASSGVECKVAVAGRRGPALPAAVGPGARRGGGQRGRLRRRRLPPSARPLQPGRRLPGGPCPPWPGWPAPRRSAASTRPPPAGARATTAGPAAGTSTAWAAGTRASCSSGPSGTCQPGPRRHRATSTTRWKRPLPPDTFAALREE